MQSSCSKKTCLISLAAVFAFLFGYEYLVHGVLLADAYKQTAALWRPEAEMQSMFHLCIIRKLALAAVLICLYKKVAKGIAAGNVCSSTGEAKPCCPYQMGLCFGVKIGLLMGILQAGAYIYMPIPGSLAVAWFAASLGEGVGVGLILALICSKQKECSGQ